MHERNVEQFFSKNTQYWQSVYTEQDKHGLTATTFQSRRASVLDVIDSLSQRGLHILDIGCGPGIFMEELVIRGHHVRGVDISLEMVKEANARLKKYRLGAELCCLQGNVETLPFEAESMDVVLCLGVLMYLRDEQQAISEIHRVLRNDGIALVVLTNLFKIGNLFDPYYYVCRGGQYLWRHVLQKRVVDRDVSPKDFGANRDFAIKRYAFNQIRGMFARQDLNEVCTVGREYGPPTFWTKSFLPARTERTISAGIHRLSRRPAFSWLNAFANEWVIVLKKSQDAHTHQQTRTTASAAGRRVEKKAANQ